MRKQTKEKRKYIIITCVLCTIITIGLLTTITSATNLDLEKETQLDIKEIIANNSQNIKKEEILTKEEDLEYTTKYIENPELPRGMIQVMQEGIDGKKEIYTKKVY